MVLPKDETHAHPSTIAHTKLITPRPEIREEQNPDRMCFQPTNNIISSQAARRRCYFTYWRSAVEKGFRGAFLPL